MRLRFRATHKQIKSDKPLRGLRLNKGVEGVGKSVDNLELENYHAEDALEFLFGGIAACQM